MPRYASIALLFLGILLFTQAKAVLKADFSVSATTGCSPLIVSFTDKSTGGATSWYWDLGNGNTSTQQNPGAIYLAGGNYSITLIVKDGFGHADTLVRKNYISVMPNPVAGFKADQVIGCTPMNVKFTDTSIAGAGPVSSWKWDFGDGNVSTTQNPVHTYSAAGTYTVSLVVTDTKGCKNTVVHSNAIQVYAKPGISFNAANRFGCSVPMTVNFSDQTTNTVAGKTTYLWKFGDGDSSTQKNPSHTYKSFGLYKVSLRVSIQGACTDSLVITDFVSIKDYKYDFKADRTKGCGLFSISFTDLTTPYESWMSYKWDFGDGKTSVARNPVHVYADTGKYTVSMIVSGLTPGCNDTVIKKKYISIGVPPTAGFVAHDSVSCSVPHTASFTNTSVNAASYEWDFGDGKTSTAKNPQHTYTSAGKYTVRLIVKNPEGCPDTMIQPDAIQVQPPTPGLWSPQPFGCVTDNTILFYDSTQTVTPILKWKWDFGDGATDSAQNVFHVYSDTGKYSVKLVIYTQGGCKDSITRQKYVKIGNKPKALFSVTPHDTCIKQMLVSFINKSATLTPKPDRYIWDFGTGEPTYETTSPFGPVHLYNVRPGKYSPSLIVFANGCSDTLVLADSINVRGPKAIFGFYQRPCTPDTVYFNNQTLGGNKFLWSFGDGDSSMQRNPSHFYDSTGFYRVRLTAWDTIAGCVNDTSLTVSIPDYAKSDPGFTVNKSSGCYPLTVQFTDTSSDAMDWTWDLGNGQVVSSRNPVADYTEPGYYTVSLTIHTSKGCQKTIVRPNMIRAYGVVPSFDICKAHECGTGSIRFTDFSRSPDPVKSRVWNFGDGTILNTTDTVVDHNFKAVPFFQYNGYTVSLTVTDSAGCSGTKTALIRPTMPRPQIGKSYQGICGGYRYYFNSYSDDYHDLGPSTFSWYFDDGYSTTGQWASRDFTKDDTVHVRLVVTDYYGCSDTAYDSVMIAIKKPKAGFAVSDTFSSCPPLQVQFSDTSVAGNFPITKYEWDFGDGSKSNLQYPKKNYVLPGKYTVRLKITDAANCTDSAVKTALIRLKGPTGTYSFTPSQGCYTLKVNFKSSSSNASQLYWDMGDGTIVNDTSFSYTYSTPGTYVPRLVLSDTLGCTYSAPAYDTIHVWPHMHPAIDVMDSTACDTGAIRFLDLTVYNTRNKTRLWDFGDGTTSSDSSPVHFYHTYDTFTVKLLVQDSTGCWDSVTRKKWIVVADQIKPRFGISQQHICEKTAVQFIDSTTTAKYSLLSWRWDFGDGDTSVSPNPVHTYNIPGNYRPRLTVTDTHGCSDTVSKVVIVRRLPVAKFVVNDGCLGDSVRFIDSSKSVEGGFGKEIWHFADGDSSNISSPLHYYKSAGTYLVSLVVNNGFGCKDTFSQNVTIHPRPVAGFRMATACPDDSAGFTDTSSVASGVISQYQWSFGDGQNSNLKSPAHQYAAGGIYNVRLIVTSDYGCRDTASGTITIPFKPQAGFTVADICQADTAAFTDKTTISSGSIISWKWDFGDGDSSAAQQPRHHYSAAGIFNVRLIVSSASSCRDTFTKAITVHPMPSAGFTASTSCFGNVTNFTDQSTLSTGSMSGYHWDFGDSSSSVLQNPQHEYAGPGTYKVILTVTTDKGCTDTASRQVTVHPKPLGRFTATTECLTNTTHFGDSSKVSGGNITSWDWNFGDGNSSSLQHPDHLYGADGEYVVSLIVTTDKGCKDTATDTVLVYPRPQARFSTAPVCQSDSASFINLSKVSTGVTAYWHWDFGDPGSAGDTSDLKNPEHRFTKADTFTVTLFVSTNQGCRDTFRDKIIIHPLPAPSFNAGNVCFGSDSVSFVNTSVIKSDSIQNWFWDLGDGTTSTDFSLKHRYATDGDYTVKLIAKSSFGCRDSVSKVITVYPKPKAGFLAANACRVDSIGFTDISTVKKGRVTAWSWDFGDGSISSLQHPKHLYAAADTYHIQLIVTTEKGCRDTTAKDVIVHPMPQAAFSVSPQCYGMANAFSDQSGIPGGSIVSWLWKFGDGLTSALQNPSHSYASSGIYTAVLIVTSDKGCSDTISHTVTVYPKPDAVFFATTECLENSTSFTDSSIVSSGKIVSWSWNFGDGGTDTLQHPHHLYTAAGSYPVRLIITTDKGCKDTSQRSVTVHPKPVSGFSFSDVCQADSASFTDQSSISGGSIANYLWDFGDSQTSSRRNPKHKYSSPGTYSVILYVQSDKGCRDTFKKDIIIHPMPKAAFTAVPVCSDDSMSFVQQSAVTTGTITGYNWDFGDGSGSALASPKHRYLPDGNYNVRLIVTTDKGCQDTVRKQVTIYPKPKADFSFNDACMADTVSFADRSSIKSGSLSAWSWDFGDGQTAATQNVKHHYTSPGTFNVRLIITTDKSCKDTLTKKVTIHPMPKAKFLASAVCYPELMIFQDQSSLAYGTISSWLWDFGDLSGKSSLQNPQHRYAAAGQYQVKLIVMTDKGCRDSVTQTITIYPKPRARFGGATVCKENITQFTDSSTVSAGSLSTWSWDFGDGNTSILQNPQHLYLLPGTYNTRLIVTTDKGCKDTTYRNITVHPKPVAAFSFSDVCQIDSAVFLNSSAISSGLISSYRWDFGDGKTSALVNLKHKYAAPGTYTVSLYVQSDKGCSDTLAQKIVVHPMPVAAFSTNPVCAKQPASFNDLSSVLTGTIKTWSWDFGDGQSATTISPTHIYSVPGTYKVRLVVGTDFGCRDTITKPVVIYPLPQPAFSYTAECAYDSVRFTDKSIISSGSILKWAWDFGDGATSLKINPVHKYAAGGTYQVRLMTTSNFGCNDTLIKSVIVHPVPDAKWFAGEVCRTFPTVFVDSTQIATGAIAAWNWDFGDGQVSALQYPQHTYLKDGVYKVRLIVTSDFGCKDTFENKVVVHPLPLAKWKGTTECRDDSTKFTDLSTIPYEQVTAWHWDFGDGQTSILQNPGHVYAKAGTYQVRQIAFSAFGCSDTFEDKVIVYPRPAGAFRADPVCFTDSTTVIDKTTIESGSVVSWFWMMGDGYIYRIPSFKHKYQAPGTYTATLVTTSDKGCVDTLRQKVRVYYLPEPDFSMSSHCAGDTIVFSDLTKTPDGKIVSRSWTFGDGSSSTDSMPKHKYRKADYYEVYLRITTDLGCTYYRRRVVQITDQHPDFEVSDSIGCMNVPLSFTDRSTGDAPFVQWLWKFGDGQTSSQQHPTHSYAKAGKYTVSLTSTDATGCSQTMKKDNIEILDDKPPRTTEVYRASVVDDDKVNITFKTYKGYDFGAYVLVRETAPGSYVPVFNSTRRWDTTFTETGLDTRRNVYCYKLLIQDRCGYTTSTDSSVSHCTMDVTASAGVNMAFVSWTPYRGWKNGVKNYVVTREDLGVPGKYDAIAVVGGQELGYADTNIVCYQTHHYRIMAIENGGNRQTSWSDTSAAHPNYIPNVLRNSIIRATVENDEYVKVEWTPSTTRRPQYYILERSTDKQNFSQAGMFGKNTFSFDDRNVAVDDISYTYRMKVMDSCGDLSPYTGIGKTILLHVSDSGATGRPELRWTKYEGWPMGVDYYEVQWLEPSTGNWKTLGVTTANDTEFTDRVTNARLRDYCYRVLGISMQDQQIVSVSNVDCVPTTMHIWVPNVFTPNDDELNETYNAKGMYVFEYHMKIFNRWGQQVFETNSFEKGWNGRFAGRDCPEGVYIYIIEAKGTGEQVFYKSGNVTLLR